MSEVTEILSQIESGDPSSTENIVFPLLIPDSQYVLYTYNAGKDRMFFKERKRFKVASGQQVDLGTVVARRK